MSEILIFRHVPCEGPGYLGQFLARLQAPYHTIQIDRGEAVPTSIDGVRGLVFMGGPMSVNDHMPWIGPALTLIRRAHHAGVSVLGHCLGGQLIARALGGAITPNAVKEIGWLPVRSCSGSPWAGWPVPDEFAAFHWHGETFSLPAGATHLFASDACANQGFQLANTIGLQFHVEMLPEMVGEWADLYADEIREPNATIQSKSEMIRDVEQRISKLNEIADVIYGYWLSRTR